MDAVTRMRNIFFLQHLDPTELEALAATMHLQEYGPGDAILNQGDHTTNFYIIDSGHVNLRHTDRSGNEQAIGSKGPGDYFGVKMFTTQEPSDYTFEAVGTAALWVMERQDWDMLLEHFPDVLNHMPELREEYARLTLGLDWLAPGEVIDLVTRRHWWALILMIGMPVSIALFSSFLYFISLRLNVVATLTWLPNVFYVALLFCAVWALWNAVNWYNDTYIVTNKRVVRINRVVFFSDSRNEIPIDKIQQQEVERRGAISALLNISNLIISSAASKGEPLVLEQIGNVERVQRAIEEERTRVVERSQAAEREHLRSMISSEIRHHVLVEPPLQEPASKPTPRRTLWQRLRARMQWQSERSLGLRLGDAWNSLLGTEIRTKRTVTWRKHYIVLFKQIALGLGALIIIGALTGFILYTRADFGFMRNGVYVGLGAAMSAAFLVVVWQWLDWRVDLYRLTETLIIDIESLPFGLRYNEKKAQLAKIQDINVQRPHLLNVLLDYGNVEVRVAGSGPAFTFASVSHPALVADELQKRIAVLAFRTHEKDAREQTRQIVDAIVAYHRLVSTERRQNGGAPSNVPPALPPPAAPPTPAHPPAPVFEGEFPPEPDLSV